MNFSLPRLLAYIAIHVGAVAAVVILLVRLFPLVSASAESFRFVIVALGIGLGLLALIVVIPGLFMMRTLRRLRREFAGSGVFRVTPYEGFDELVARYSTRPTSIPPWDVYLVVDEEFLSFISGAARSELLTLRRDQIVVSHVHYFGWASVFPVLRLTVPGFPDAALAVPIVWTLGLFTHSTRFLRKNLPAN